MYVFFGRKLRADAHYDEPLSEQLRRCHLLNTSKALCVEFLQVFVRQTAFDYCPADCGPWSHDACTHRNFERFLDFINRRIDLGSYTRGVDFWFYCYVPWGWPNIPYRTLRVRARCQRLVPEPSISYGNGTKGSGLQARTCTLESNTLARVLQP